jgi:hypothetical protein
MCERHSMASHVPRAALIVIVTSTLATSLAAQTRTVGAIAGTVVDDHAAVVPGATVRLRDERAGTERENVTNGQGFFSFLDLQAGSYEVTVSLQGFQVTVFRGVAVESARTTDVRVRLQLGPLDETVEVIGATPTLQLTSTTIGTTVTNADVQNLPLAGRNVLNFATLVSGSQVAGVDPRQSTYQGMPGATINISLDAQGHRFHRRGPHEHLDRGAQRVEQHELPRRQRPRAGRRHQLDDVRPDQRCRCAAQRADSRQS